MLVSTPGWADELWLTSGWPTALDLKSVQSARSADPTIVTVDGIDDDQLLLIGAVPGVTTVSVWTGSAIAPLRTDYRVTVTRFATLQSRDGIVKVSVDQNRTLKLPGVKRVVVGDASICEANFNGADGLELAPRQPGMISVLVWINGLDAAHRRQVLIIVESGGVARTVDELDSVLTEPIDGRLVLIAGEHAIIAAAGVTQFAMKDSAVAQPRGGHSGELIIEARAEGATWLLLWNGNRRARKHFVVVHSRTWVEAEPDDGVRSPVPVRSTPEVEFQNR